MLASNLRLLASSWTLARNRSIQGHLSLDQARRFAEDFTATFESVRLDADELMDAGEHMVLVGTVHFCGRDGIEATASAKQVWTIHDGAGVSPEDPHGMELRPGMGHLGNLKACR